MRSHPARRLAAFPVAVGIVAAAMLSACASPAPAPEAPAPDPAVQVAAAAPAATASAPRRVCTRERPIGSSMAQTVCRNVDEHGDPVDIANMVETLNRNATNGNAAQMSRTGGH